MVEGGKTVVGCYTNAGRRYGSLNQDRFLAVRLSPGKNYWLLGTFDGHGLLGECAAEAASEAVKSAFTSKQVVWAGGGPQDDAVAAFMADPHTNMTKLFDIAHEAVIKLYSQLPETYTYFNGKEYRLEWDNDVPVYRYSMLEKRDLEFGTTAVVVLYADGVLVAGNAGDSKAYVLQQDYTGFSPDGIRCFEITQLHTVANPQEALRLTAIGRTTFTSEEYIRPADSRWAGHQVAFSRALGHKFLEEFGISHYPSVHVRKCGKDDFAIVLTTDGVTDLLLPHELAERVAGTTSAQLAARSLVEDALLMCEGDEDADNTTAVVLMTSH